MSRFCRHFHSRLTGVSTFYPFGGYAVTGGEVTKHYFFNGEALALRKGSGVYFLYHDRLGSTIRATDAYNQVSGQRGYDAFGGKRRSSGELPTDYLYTGQEEDSGTGLLYYNARYYDPQLGQFLSPDTIVPEPTSFLDYNRYLYARGNPLKYSDPTGHIPEREACSYLQACSKQEFVDKYGLELADLLWGTDVGWGDKLSWGNNNVGMLVLLDPGTGKHTGVLWGITGRSVGKPIYLDLLHKEGITEFDVTEATDVDTVWDLPMDPSFKYGGYYPTEYVDVSELWWLSMVGGIAGIGQKAGYIASVISGSSQLINGADKVDDLQIVQSLEADKTVGGLARGTSYWWAKTFGQAQTSYSTIRFSPSGSLNITLHLKGPGGAQ